MSIDRAQRKRTTARDTGQRTAADTESPASLIDTASALLHTNPGRAVELAMQAYDLASAVGAPREQGLALATAGEGHYHLREYHKALSLCDQSYSLLLPLGDRPLLARMMNRIGLIHYFLGEFGKALETLTEGRRFVDDPTDELWIVLRGNAALVYRELGAYREALELLLEVLGRLEDRVDPKLAITLDSIATIYASLEEFDNCIAYQLRSLEIARSCGYRQGEAMALGNLGAAHNDIDRYEQALGYLNEALTLYRSIGDIEGEARALQNIGVAYNRMGEYRKALQFFRKALRTDLKNSRTGSRGNALANIGDIQHRMGRVPQAARTLEQALRIATECRDIDLQYKIHLTLSEVHESLGNLQRALDHHRRYADLRAGAANKKTRQTIAELQIRFDVERSERERELYRLKNARLEQDLQLKNAELTAMALRLVERTETLHTVRSGLTQVLTIQNGSAHPLLRTVLQTVDGAESHRDWEAFDSQFRQVHPHFTRSLSERYPRLSPSELKICALLKVNLSSKEIARLLYVSVRDVENHRYRIRKKLGIDTTVNLGSFLAAL